MHLIFKLKAFICLFRKIYSFWIWCLQLSLFDLHSVLLLHLPGSLHTPHSCSPSTNYTHLQLLHTHQTHYILYTGLSLLQLPDCSLLCKDFQRSSTWSPAFDFACPQFICLMQVLPVSSKVLFACRCRHFTSSFQCFVLVCLVGSVCYVVLKLRLSKLILWSTELHFGSNHTCYSNTIQKSFNVQQKTRKIEKC